MTIHFRTVVATFIGLLLVLFLYLAAPSGVYHPRGILLPSKVTYSSIPVSNVKIVSRVSYPYQVVGRINIQMQFMPDSSKQDVDRILNKARQLASEVGANTIIVGPNTIWHPSVDMLPFNQVHWIFSATAATVSESLVPLEPGIVKPAH